MDRWQVFLSEQGAIWKDGRLQSFDAGRDVMRSLQLVPMTEHSLITLEGPDAEKFLQGQLTCDLRRLQQSHRLQGAHCNVKGRMISSFTLASSGANRITLRLRKDIAASASAALQKYIVFSKAKIHQEEAVALSVFGDSSLEFLPLPLPEPGSSITKERLTVINHGASHVELWVPADQAEQVWVQLATECTPYPPGYLDMQLVKRGLAEVQLATQEEFIPQMFNYQLTDAISFKKGCYTGQEIVARMHYRGQLKKHTYRASVATTTAVPVGSDVVAADSPERTVGTVVAAAVGGGETQEILVVTTEDIAASDAVTVATDTRAKLTWLPLPYAIP